MSKRITTEEFKDRLYSLYGDRFTLLSEYTNNHTKVELICNTCGAHIFKRPCKMTNTTMEGCYVCAGKNSYKTKDALQHEADIKYPGRYLIIGEYVRARAPLRIMNNECGHEYNISPDNLLRGKGCPRCGMRQSSYMDIVEEYLSSNSIGYVKEKTFPGCRNIRSLPFDYYIPSLNICIEVDGEQHFERHTKSGKEIALNPQTKFSKIHQRDCIKTEYCKAAGIKLIRLPYYKVDEFSQILDSELHANTEITTGHKQPVVL